MVGKLPPRNMKLCQEQVYDLLSILWTTKKNLCFSFVRNLDKMGNQVGRFLKLYILHSYCYLDDGLHRFDAAYSGINQRLVNMNGSTGAHVTSCRSANNTSQQPVMSYFLLIKKMGLALEWNTTVSGCGSGRLFELSFRI